MRSDYLYSKLRDAASSYNQLNRTFISLEKHLTISEFVEIRTHIYNEPSKDSKKLAEKEWLDSFNKHKVAIKHPTNFKRDWTRNLASKYSIQTHNDRHLVIAFAGKQGRIMMPTWAFLASLPSNVSDALILRTKWNVESPQFSYPDKFDSLWEIVKSEIDRSNYSEISVIGVSAGTLPALITGKLINAERTILVSMLSSDDSYYKEEYRIVEKLQESDTSKVCFVVTYRDPKAIEIARTFSEKYRNVRLKKYITPDHAIFSYLLRRGRLPITLRKLLS